MSKELEGIWRGCNKAGNETDAINIKEGMKTWLMIL